MLNTLQASAEAPDGIVTLPRCAFLLGMRSRSGHNRTDIFGRLLTAELDSSIGGLAGNDLRLSERLLILERDRDRLPKLKERFGRIEEKMYTMIELMRETRQERQSPPKRGG
ncbi:hypothetical protein [Methylorubrum extorquens]